MSDQRNGGIVWTNHTWNPIRGCSRVSAGCMNCYAESMAGRFSGIGHPYEGLTAKDSHGRAKWTGKIKLVHEHLEDPLRSMRMNTKSPQPQKREWKQKKHDLPRAHRRPVSPGLCDLQAAAHRGEPAKGTINAQHTRQPENGGDRAEQKRATETREACTDAAGTNLSRGNNEHN